MFTKVFGQTVTRRIDPEYFQQKFIDDERLLEQRRNDFCSLAKLGLTVDASAFYPSIEGYYGEGSLPFLRVADVNSIIDFEGCTTIPENLCSLYPTLAKVKPGDILFTKGGSIARVGLVTKPAAVSRDLIFLNSSKLSREDQAYLYLYFQSDFFNRALIRSSSQTAQPHLTITLVRELRTLIASDIFKGRMRVLVSAAFDSRAAAIKYRQEADATLLRAIGLKGWRAPECLSYVRSCKEAFAAGRLDAEHFQPRFSALLAHLEATGQAQDLGVALTLNQRGKQPEYSDTGLSVVNSKHVIGGEVRLDGDNRTAAFDEKSMLIQFGDVLMNGTGVGTIGRSAPYLHAAKSIPDNHVTILRPSAGLDPIYLSVFLNSQAGQLQVAQRLRGSSGQIELYPNDIARFKIWKASEETQLEIRKAVVESFEQKQRATKLLEVAKRAMEIAIEDNEAAALGYLDGIGA